MEKMENKICICIDWQVNMPILDSMVIMDAIHTWGQGGYKGKRFAFCPWCGKELIKEGKGKE